jgi:hypothetical protein
LLRPSIARRHKDRLSSEPPKLSTPCCDCCLACQHQTRTQTDGPPSIILRCKPGSDTAVSSTRCARPYFADSQMLITIPIAVRMTLTMPAHPAILAHRKMADCWAVSSAFFSASQSAGDQTRVRWSELRDCGFRGLRWDREVLPCKHHGQTLPRFGGAFFPGAGNKSPDWAAGAYSRGTHEEKPDPVVGGSGRL